MRFTARPKSLRSFFAADNGATAVEFAFVAPPFIWLFFAIFETGLMLFGEYSLQTGVQEAARKIRTGEAIKDAWSVGQFLDEVCSNAVVMSDCKTKASVLVESVATNFKQLSESVPGSKLDVGPPAAGGAPKRQFNPGKSSYYTAVYVTYDWEFKLPWMSAFGNVASNTRRVVAYTVFRNEPF
jgi:Flp pilus assembly protein TadG